jgi:hypothetical protein
MPEVVDMDQDLIDSIIGRFWSESTTWSSAEARCLSWGGNLASISNEDENRFARTFSNLEFWIGYTDQLSEGSWLWADDSKSTYTNWHTINNQPDNCCSGENCAAMIGNGFAQTHLREVINGPSVQAGYWIDVDCVQNTVYGFGLGKAPVQGFLCSRVICSPGTYLNANAGGSSIEHVCTNCSPGTFSSAVGASECQFCNAGSYAELSQSSCSLCLAGTYSTGVKAESSETCKVCQAGTFSTTLGAAAMVTCATCEAGTYSEPGTLQLLDYMISCFSQTSRLLTVVESMLAYYLAHPK